MRALLLDHETNVVTLRASHRYRGASPIAPSESRVPALRGCLLHPGSAHAAPAST